jgi:hypothetical protein
MGAQRAQKGAKGRMHACMHTYAMFVYVHAVPMRCVCVILATRDSGVGENPKSYEKLARKPTYLKPKFQEMYVCM